MKKIISNHKLQFLLYIIVFTNLSRFTDEVYGGTGSGKYGASFLQINSGARQVAMANAFTALAYEDINLMRYNIGGLGSIRNKMFAVNYNNWIDDTHQGALSFAYPLSFGVVGFDLIYFNEGKLTEIDQNFTPTGNVLHSYDMAVSVGYGSFLNLFDNRFLYGGSLKFIGQSLVQEYAHAFGLDFGAVYRLKYLSFGASIQNIGMTKLKFIEQKESLPLTYRGGIGGHFFVTDNFEWNIDFDVAYLQDQDLRYYAGAECIINDLLMIRGGYKIHDFEQNRWAAGLGLNIPMDWLAGSNTRLDYSYAPLDAFDSATHRFSLLFRFGKEVKLVDEKRLAELNERLRKQITEAEKLRLEAEEREQRMRALEDTLRARLERVKKIAAEDEKIDVKEIPSDRETEPPEGVLVTTRINFDFDKANIRPDMYETMNRVADILNTYPERRVFVAGHTDSIGSYEYNIRLSHRRVDSVMSFLTLKEDVDYDRFYNPIGYGELRPVADNGTPGGRFRNRRVDFLIYTRDKKPEMPVGSAIKAVELIDNSTVHIVGNGKLNFSHKMMRDPRHKLIVDFPNVYLITDMKKFDLFRGPFERARVGYHPEFRMSRVVFDLYHPIDYDIEAQDNLVIIKVR